MPSSYGKTKGSRYERNICKRLSLWVSDLQNRDCFWRSAMSGGRNTHARKTTGESLEYCAGDITATSPEGMLLTRLFVVECKFYANLQLHNHFFGRKGKLLKWWKTLLKECDSGREPLLFAKQNLLPEIVFTSPRGYRILQTAGILPYQAMIWHPKREMVCLSTQDVLNLNFGGIRRVYERYSLKGKKLVRT